MVISMFEAVIPLILCLQSALGATSPITSISIPADQLTCPSRTVNYLTHTLPQQCLPSLRTGGPDPKQENNSTITNLPVSASTVISDGSAGTGQESREIHTIDSLRNFTSSHIDAPSSLTSTSTQSVTTVIATPLASTLPVPSIPSTVDDDSPLESGNFLSFEEWKRQNLIKAGQSEHVGRHINLERKPNKGPGNVHNTLDSLGDDAEIDLDFSGLVSGGSESVPNLINKHVGQNADSTTLADSGSKPGIQNKRRDAGTTSKERFNYASLDCAASVLKTNSEAKSPNTVLLENKDLYMLNKCSVENKFIILELCHDISIDTIVLANFEFFSSSFRTFRVSVSDKYPVKIDKWKNLGMFEARNTREIQAFLVENPIIWARYIRFEFLTHYGSEFYCPVSLIRVHGTTMMEDYKHDLEINAEEDDDDDENEETIETSGAELVSGAVDGPLLLEQKGRADAGTQDLPLVQTSILSSVACQYESAESPKFIEQENTTSPNQILLAHDALYTGNAEICHITDEPICVPLEVPEISKTSSSTIEASSTPVSLVQSEDVKNIPSIAKSRSPSLLSTVHTHTGESSPTPHKELQNSIAGSISTDNKKSVSTSSEHSRSHSISKDANRSNPVKHSGSATHPQPASPTMQESFFKSVQKRLQMLESNSSLSLQYIEEQSRALRDALRKVEQRQLSKTSVFLEHLNQTVLNELREFRQQYDQLWQSTVIELALQRERYQQESQAMHARLGVLADELIFQRRVSILQMVLILLCLALVLFSRGGLNTYLELPLVQSVLSKSPGSRWTNMSGDSRANSPAMGRTRSTDRIGTKQGILKGHNRGLSEDSNNEPLSATEMYSPPTPVSFDGYSDAELVKTESKMEDPNPDPEYDPLHIERPSTSPPVLPGAEDPATPTSLTYLGETSIDERLLTPPSTDDRRHTLQVNIEHPTPPGRRLTWDLPD